MAIEQKSFSSSLIDTAEYDADKKLLTVNFLNGRSYEHQDVTPDVWAGLRDAFSAGRFWNQFLKGRF